MLAASVALVAIAVATPAAASVVFVASTVSGSAGAWVHNFSVFNNLPNTNQIYFFGVQLATGRDIAGSPVNFDPDSWPSWDNIPLGGSATVYNNNWINFASGYIAPGGSLGGFKALDTGAVPTTVIPYFVYAFGGNYTGPECFTCGSNPGFEGLVAVATFVPEPASWAMLIAGFGLTGAAMRRRRAVAVA